MLPLKWRLEQAGVAPVEVAAMPRLGMQDVWTLAAAVREAVNDARDRHGAERVDLVGVSQGGLAALAYLQAGGAEHVRRFVALGTPFHGTWFAALGVPLVGAVSRGVWQSLPKSELVQELVAGGAPEGVEVISVAIPGDPVAPPARCALPGAQLVMAPPTRNPLRHQALIASRGCADITARCLLAP